MADVVRLAIVYDVADAAQKVSDLDNRLDRLDGASRTATGSMRGATVATARLAQGMLMGNISAVGMFSSIERVAAFLLGPWGLAIGVAVAGLFAWVSHTAKLREETAKMEERLRQTNRHIHDLLHPESTVPFQSEIETLTSKIEDLDIAINTAQHSWLGMIQAFLHNLLPNVFNAPASLQIRERSGLRGARGELTPEAAFKAESEAFSRARGEQHAILIGENVGPIGKLQQNLADLQAHFERLVKLGFDPLSAAGQDMQAEMAGLTKELEHMQRAAAVMEQGLNAIGDAVTGFVLTATFEFSKLIDNLLTILLKSVQGQIVTDLLNAVGLGSKAPSPGTAGSVGLSFQEGGIVPGVGPQLAVVHGGEEIIPAGRGSVATQVTFNVQALDSRSVAEFFEQNGGAIAAEVSRQAARSQAVRRRFAR